MGKAKKNIMFQLPGYKWEDQHGHLINLMDTDGCSDGLVIKTFSDGEKTAHYQYSVRNKNVYLYGSTATDKDIMSILLAIDAAKRSGAKKVNLIIPYFGYARQDKKSIHRGGIGGKLMANMLTTAGASSIMVIDLHSDGVEGFFDIPVIHLSGHVIFGDHLTKLIGDDNDYVICSPDHGGTSRAKNFAKMLNLPMVVFDKERIVANKVNNMTLIGDVKGKNVIVVDDIGDTLGTLCLGAEKLREAGANKVYACLSHGVFSGTAMAKLEKSVIEKIFVLDTIAKKPTNNTDKLEYISTTPYISEVLSRVLSKQPIS